MSLFGNLFSGAAQGLGGLFGSHPQAGQQVPPQSGGGFGQAVGGALQNFARLPFDYVNAYSSQLQSVPRAFDRLRDDEATKHQLSAIANRLGTPQEQPNDRQLFAALSNSAEFGKALSSNVEASNVPGGATRMINIGGGANERMLTAPRLGDSNGVAFTQTPDKTTETGSWPVSVGPDSSLVDPVSGTPTFKPPPKLPDSIPEYIPDPTTPGKFIINPMKIEFEKRVAMARAGANAAFRVGRQGGGAAAPGSLTFAPLPPPPR